MTTTVRISDEDRDRLERLRRAWHARRGERPTVQGILHAALTLAERRADELLSPAVQPFTKKEYERLYRECASSWEGSSQDIDDVVYP